MGRNWAIVVGINHYENLRWLKYAKQDALVMAAWFQQEANFERVFLFTDDSPPIAANPPIPTQPTFGHLRRFLRAQFENIEKPLLKPEDNLWFFFAGHGNRHQDQDYLMFSDSDPGDIKHTAISVDYVTQRLRRSGADNVVLFLDACRDESSRAGLGFGEQSCKGVITFYSCTANQKSWEIEQLQHGSFTHCLLKGLRLQGESNCATVDRLAKHLRYQVPLVNTRYGKPIQNPYLQAEPPYKLYSILLEQTATPEDIVQLKYEASQAENRGDLSLAKQLWLRVLALYHDDSEVIDAIERMARKRVNFEPTISTSEPVTSSNGGRSVSSQPASGSSTPPEPNQELPFAQKQEEYRQNLVRYQQAFSEAIEQEFPLSESTRRHLKQLQESLELKEEEILQIEQPIVIKKEIEHHKQQQASKQQLNTLQPSRSLVIEFETATVNSQGEITARQRSNVRYRAENLDNGLELEMVFIPRDRFMMGSLDSEVEGHIDESPQHQVTVAAFFMSKYPITQAQWTLVANLPQVKLELEPYPSYFKGEKLPVECISWYEAVEFCARLSKVTEQAYRLPTEAEWEYACRANTVTSFYFGQTITTELANFNGQSVDGSAPKGEYRRRTTEVGYFQYANAFGLYDMHGNVGEWCLDNWHVNYNNAPTNGSAWMEGGDNRYRVLRGGCWSLYAKCCRSANRGKSEPDKKSNRIGFRVVFSSSRISK
jgi:formylglycine-generating enzyme required for sulfatase activity/uncharacterized caspase-like protein